MNDRDRALLALLGAGLLLAWWQSLPKGLGWPGLGDGPDARDQGGTATKRPPKGIATQSTPSAQNGRQGGQAKPYDGAIIDVSSPEVVSPEEYARRARARARKP